MEKFDSDIALEIEGLLKHVDLGDADIYLRLYMIGKSPSKSRPVIMVCCSNSQVRAQAEEAIRASQIPQLYPEFSLGACAIPLEQPGLIRALTGKADKASATGRKAGPPQHGKWKGERHESKELPTGATPSNPNQTVGRSPQLVGRRIYARVVRLGDSAPLQPATGGAVIQLGGHLGSCYQLTVSHVLEPAPVPESNLCDLDEFHFDDMSDEEYDDETSTASAASTASTAPAPEVVTSSCANPPPADAAVSSTTISSWKFMLDSRNGPNPGLDYALLELNDGSLELNYMYEDYMYMSLFPNRIAMPGDRRKGVKIREVARMPPLKEEEVLVVTASRGVTHGVLLPTAVYFRNASLPGFQELYPVVLQDYVSVGDSGSVIVGKTSGQLFGHLVRGVPGSMTAYIVAATQVFSDIRERTGLEVGPARVIDIRDAQAALRRDRRGGTGASEDTVPGPEEIRQMPPGTIDLRPTPPTTVHPYTPTVAPTPDLIPKSQDGAEIDIDITPSSGNAEIGTADRDTRSSYITADNDWSWINIDEDGGPPRTSPSLSVAGNPDTELSDVKEDSDSPYPVYEKLSRQVQTPDSRARRLSFPSLPEEKAPHNNLASLLSINPHRTAHFSQRDRDSRPDRDSRQPSPPPSPPPPPPLPDWD
jgi:hypothetical protein